MSRVRKPRNKYMNVNRYDSSVTDPSKKVRIHFEEDTGVKRNLQGKEEYMNFFE